MKKFTRFCLITGIVLCIIGGSAMAAGYAGGAWSEVTGKSSSLVGLGTTTVVTTKDSAKTESLTLDPGEYSYLQFQLSSEDITIRPSQDGKIHIRYQDHEHVRYQTRTEAPAAGGSGSTYVFSRMELTSSFNFGFHFDTDEGIQVSVPQGMGVSVSTVSGEIELSDISLKRLDVTSSSGDIDLSGVAITGDLLLSSISGDLELSSVTVSGSAKLETTSGEMEWKSCQLAAASLYTVSGDISGSVQAAGDLSLDTTSGDIDLDLRGSPSHRQGGVSAVSGDVKMEGMDPDGEYTIDAETVSGDVHIRH